ncbi:uncharacterized protein [Rutidosis leptorrhynchoides]|uniref:uncharacterized protein n=1 Tax=Rutidosis leptorrhynchoides TaxID=125765 RepID=UPI003A998EE8
MFQLPITPKKDPNQKTLQKIRQLALIILINIHGFGKDDESKSKVGWFRKIKLSNKPDIILVQESKCNAVNDNWIESLWGNSSFGYVQKPKIGKSGGLLTIWDSSTFKVNDAVENRHFIAIRGRWIGKEKDTIIVNVYGPHKDDGKGFFWDSLVKSLFNTLKRQNEDFGPKPFKIFDVWLKDKSVDAVIIDAWNAHVYGSRPDCVFRNKLKNVKEALRSWSKNNYGIIDKDIDKWKLIADEFESKAEQGLLSEVEHNDWMNARINWLQRDNEKEEMLRQKSRLKWVAEGDDNTSYFHSSIRRHNNSSKIRGLHLNGIWVEQPITIKEAVYNKVSNSPSNQDEISKAS